MRCFYYKNLGKYNLLNNEKQWQVYICFCPEEKGAHISFAETWGEENEPAIEGLLPSEVLSLIKDRLASYWISTNRQATLERMDDLEDDLPKYDIAWINARIQEKEKEIKVLQGQLEDLENL